MRSSTKPGITKIEHIPRGQNTGYLLYNIVHVLNCDSRRMGGGRPFVLQCDFIICSSFSIDAFLLMLLLLEKQVCELQSWLATACKLPQPGPEPELCKAEKVPTTATSSTCSTTATNSTITPCSTTAAVTSTVAATAACSSSAGSVMLPSASSSRHEDAFLYLIDIY